MEIYWDNTPFVNLLHPYFIIVLCKVIDESIAPTVGLMAFSGKKVLYKLQAELWSIL